MVEMTEFKPTGVMTLEKPNGRWVSTEVQVLDRTSNHLKVVISEKTGFSNGWYFIGTINGRRGVVYEDFRNREDER
jgi:hypothetical protein